METVFHTRSMISRAWSTFKTHWKFIIPAGILTALVSGAAQSLSGRGHESLFMVIVLSIISTVVSTVVGIIIALGWSQVMIRLIRTGKPDWNDFRTKPTLWGRYFLASLLYGLIILPLVGLMVIGLLLGIGSNGSNIFILVIAIILGLIGITGVIWLAIRMMFMPMIAVDYQDLGVKALLKQSFTMTQGHVGTLIKLSCWQFLVFMAGLIALVVGLVVAIPIIYISKVHMYEHLKSFQKA
jgi:type III secretory pathway component EscS